MASYDETKSWLEPPYAYAQILDHIDFFYVLFFNLTIHSFIKSTHKESTYTKRMIKVYFEL